MKIVFSRKGFDSGAGGAPSPIVDGAPVSLPIPTRRRSLTRYGDLGLSKRVVEATRGRMRGDEPCHNDPMFEAGRCAFGQAGAAQAHLDNQGVAEGDVFLFFGLFARSGGRDPHHRIFGWMRVERRIPLGPAPGPDDQPDGFRHRHPHTLGDWNANNTLHVGPGGVARTAPDLLRLSVPGGPRSRWRVPPWLRETGLSFHGSAERWSDEGRLAVVARGQEFVADIGDREDARAWLASVIDAIGAEPA